MDYTKCLIPTISWALSALSYDENNVQRRISQLFPPFKTHFWSHNHGSHFHGVVMDRENDRAWHVHRGTDGDNGYGEFLSWLYDANMFFGPDGTHNGFCRLAHTAFDEAKGYLEDYNYLYECGHSQGSGVAPIDSCLCVENLTFKHVQCDLFAAPPCFKLIGAVRFNKHMADGKLSCTRYVNPNDPVASSILRNGKSMLLNGVDVGEEVILADITPQRLGPIEVLNHSCAQYNAAYMIHLINNCNSVPVLDIKLLAEINEWIVN